MIVGAATLLAERGLQRTSFAEVLELTGAPRGSIYHHFPGGKQELVTEAVRMVGDRLVGALEALGPLDAPEVVDRFLQLWRGVLVGGDLSSGCAVAAVTVDAQEEDPQLVAAAARVFAQWTDVLGAHLAAGGVPEADAVPLATTVIAGVEGALILSRARHDVAVFDAVAGQLVQLARAASTSSAG
jgi:AcrR family transcriptional regulator